MTERKLLEIPIYSMSKETFLKRWNNRYDKRVQDLMLSGHRTYETAKKDARVCTFPYNVWEYNQIIGYIVISISFNDVYFHQFRSLDSVYRFDSRVKHFIQHTERVNNHFPVLSHYTNEEIKENIRHWVYSLSKEIESDGHYLDISAFENILGYLDIRRFIDDFPKNRY